MSIEPAHDRDDEEIGRLLRTIAEDAAPVDPAALDRIAALTGNLFPSAAEAEPPPPVAPAPHSQPLPRASGSRPMFFSVTRLLATVSAAVAVLVLWFSADSVVPANLAVADVLRPVVDARTLQLSIVRDGLVSNVFVQHPGLVRVEESPTRYLVARGSHFWQIDGDSTEAAADDRHWVRPDGAIDLLGLIGIDPRERPTFDHLRPSGRKSFAGRDAWTFTRRVVQEDRSLRIDLYADAKSHEFLGITARDAKAPAGGPPLAELTLVALNPPLAGTLFAVADTLNVEGIGKVTDVQGIVTLRPLTSDRWTVVCREVPLQPGDWIRTSPRGANAARVALTGGTTLTIGPDSLLEVQEAGKIRLTSGECQIDRGEEGNTPFELLGPKDGSERIAGGKHLFRVTKEETLAKVADAPLWLKGFEGATSNESIGSLIVNVDGRNEPLTVGEHKVTIDIRDQIARTTIEETFVNRTKSRLEGQFHFPLPQDASISGFGMWIGDQLVEADIVEKQRAREIFETILRENRDPGLLEWAGGNIFKARVFPIEPLSEKRIKITYTQVLPLRANRYRYSYGLRSELLQKFPLRELSVQVNVHSALPLKSVTCPTYACRSQGTPHSARLDFTAKEFTPPRDFDVVCEVDGTNAQVVAIPHRRGDDGYLMLQLMPPSGEGNWQREVLPKGERADFLILCDTSGSMDSTMRKTQAEFVTALLSALGPKDRFNIGVCDVETAWLFPEPMTQKDDVLAQVQSKLAERASLGWSDLDKGLASALDKAQGLMTETKRGSTPQIVYVGDGIVAGVNSDPQAFAARIRQLAATRRKVVDGKEKPMPTIHSVSVGSTYETVSLKAMAAIGGGSMRQITGDQTPPVVAHELLNEILQPGLKDLAVEFKGLRVAAMYPERLPNLPAGMQQILVGRYLPEPNKDGAPQSGEVIVTGTRGGETVRYAARISLPAAANEERPDENSFIPRLWARAHLDQLLLQGSSPFLQDEIIRLSEEFHIITPYTSLLVLESDADRERFGVKKRYEMRDGERFFADGKAAVRYDLAQQQMQRAGAWRQGLRRQILAAYARLGREVPDARVRRGFSSIQFDRRSLSSDSWSADESGMNYFSRFSGGYAGSGEVFYDSLQLESRGTIEDLVSERKQLSELGLRQEMNAPFAPSAAPMSGEYLGFDVDAKNDGYADGLDVSRDFQTALPALQKALGDSDAEYFSPLWDGAELAAAAKRYSVREAETPLSILDPYGMDGSSPELPWGRLGAFSSEYAIERGAVSLKEVGFSLTAMGRAKREAYPRIGIEWLGLFPTLPPVPAERKPVRPPSWWTAEALELTRLLDRTETLQALPDGLEVVRTTRNFHEGWRRMIEGTPHRELRRGTTWLDRETGQGNPTTIHWHDGKERGVLTVSLPFGVTRPAEKRDGERLDSVLASIDLTRMYRNHVPTIERPEANRVVLTLTSRDDAKVVFRVTIDTEKKHILKQEALHDGKLLSTSEFSDFVEVAGLWFARKSMTRDGDGFEIASATIEIERLAADEFERRYKAELAVRERTLLWTQPMSKLAAARAKAADGTASLTDRLLILAERTARQQWDDAFQQLAVIETSQAGQPGLPWLRIGLEKVAGRHEEVRGHLMQRLDAALTDMSGEALHRVQHILDTFYSNSGWHEYGKFVEKARPVYERQPDPAVGLHEWKRRQVECLRYTGRLEESVALRKESAAELPGDVGEQTVCATALWEMGKKAEAYEWLDRTLAYGAGKHERPLRWNEWTYRDIHATRARLLRNDTRWGDLLRHVAGWIEQNPTFAEPYSEYLSARIYNDEIAQAEEQVRQWLAASRVERKLTEPERARLSAAVGFALGDISHISSRNVLVPQWSPALEETAAYFVKHPDHSDVTRQIVSHHRFQGTDAADRVRGLIRLRLNEAAGTLPATTVQAFVELVLNHRCVMVEGPDRLKVESIPLSEWAALTKTLQTRWDTEPKTETRRTIAATLTSIYALHFTDTEHLPFLRARLQRAEEALAARPADLDLEARPEKDLGDYVESERSELYEALLSRPWTEAIETELFTQLPRFGAGMEAPQRLDVWLGRLQTLVDKMLAGRQAARMTELTDSGETEKLTRPQLQEKQTEFQKTARQELAKRLQSEAEAQRADADRAGWLTMERARLDILLEQNLEGVWGEMQERLGPAPAGMLENDEDWGPDRVAHELSQTLLRSRALAASLFLASRDKAPKDWADKVLKYLDAGIAKGGAAAAVWKSGKYQFLVALDRVDDIETSLKAWTADDPQAPVWRLVLARIRAERGDVPGAIALLEEVQKGSPLTPPDLAMLADLYLAANRKGDFERTRLAKFEQMEEWRLSNWIGQQQNRFTNHGGDLDEQLLAAVQALFAKASHPENYLYQIRTLYQATRDFRVLRMIPDLTIGRTRERIYGTLQHLDGQVLWDLKEAAADEILERLRLVRKETAAALAAIADTAPDADILRRARRLDLRALDLIEGIVERRSAEVPNSPDVHARAALAAFRRAFDGDWQEGERRMMSAVLKDLRKIAHPGLAEERQREFRELIAGSPPLSDEALAVTADFAHILYWYDMDFPRPNTGRPAALMLLSNAIRDRLQQDKGIWPVALNGVLGEYLGQLRDSRQYTTAEEMLEKILAALPEDQRPAIESERWATWVHALEHDGRVSLGEGEALLTALYERSLDRIRAAADNERYSRIVETTQLLSTASQKGLPNARPLLSRFAFDTLPGLLTPSMHNYDSAVSQVSSIVRQHLDRREDLRFLLRSLQKYPVWFQYSYSDGWNYHGSQMASLRTEIGDIGDLEAPLLELVLGYLRKELLTRDARNQSFTRANYGYFWSEKRADFLRVAEEVLAAEKNSPRIIEYVAEYLFRGLNAQPRAIEVLFIAHRRGLLDDRVIDTLVHYLMEERRHAEAAPLLEGLVDREPENLNHRTDLLICYHESKRPQQVKELYDRTRADFQKKGRWTADAMAQMADACRRSDLPQEARDLYTGAIQRRQRESANRGIGDETLSRWYQHLAAIHSQLGDTAAAVEAASGAIVCWSPRHDQRRQAIEALESVVASAKDLDAYVATVDAKSRESGQDSPIVRAAIGKAWRDRMAWDKAIAQYELARQLQPNNRAINEALLACYDAKGDKPGAVRQLLGMIDLDRHNLDLLKQLAERSKEDSSLAERAATSIVESAPNEAEHHAALAELRQSQDRWNEAIPHWEQVAELRKLEPTGLIRLAKALVHVKQFGRAKEVLAQYRKKEWPSRFDNLQEEVRRLETSLSQ